jgi:PepSY-associated TM region
MSVRLPRRIHRLLGLFVGIQLLFWTVSGMIFSWNDIHSVRGEHLTNSVSISVLQDQQLIPLQQVLEECSLPVHELRLTAVAGIPVYILACSGSGPPSLLINAATGEQMSPITQELANRIATNDFLPEATIRNTTLVEETSSHSEYRGKVLPVWCVEFDHSSDTCIYVAADTGQITARRNNQWRVFDFFWMLHTMDFAGRDNFNHAGIQAVSVLAVLTVLSGYYLWYRTRRRRRKVNAPRVTAL